MDSNAIAHALGLPFEALEIQVIVRELGLNTTPRAKRDDPDAYLEAKAEGIALMFVDDDYMKRTPVIRYGNGRMVFVSATLYSGRQSDDPSYRRFDGLLPQGVAFDDDPEQLENKLGPPTRVAEDEGIVYTRSWKRGASWLSFNYSSSGVLEYVQLNWDVYRTRVREG